MVATRASDADRDSCLEDIEAAYADGRINDAEREARTQAALQATTLAELAELVADLGPAATLPAKVAAALSARRKPGGSQGLSPRALRILLLVVLVPAVIAVVVWISTAGDDKKAATPGSTSQQTVPKERLELHTAEGFARLVALTKAKFGTTIVDSAAIYPDYASITVVMKDDPRRAENWFFGKGFEGDPTKGSRQAEAATIDLASIDPAAYARAVNRSPSVLGVEDVTSTYVVIHDTGGEPSFSVYVSNEYSENGYWTFTPAGKEISRYAFE
ncbi:DUF1707 domain-containing protein [Aeromicrobium sp. 9AM]|uniref:DUF1707 SHOCT-like domain-containing protein n=1 Tax=Aeromicrobium sp. 9AM TaxID=2653126 RepID=UPI001357B1CE|nr:DUF1707 domain-containing protein [Aeromicrobium sp. 9AM]